MLVQLQDNLNMYTAEGDVATVNTTCMKRTFSAAHVTFVWMLPGASA